MSQVGSPAADIRQAQVTVPTGTTQAAPFTTTINLGDVWVEWIEIDVPPGPSGVVFFNLAYGGMGLVPSGVPLLFLNPDDWTATYPVNAEIPGKMTFTGWNLGGYSHTVTFRFLATPIAAWRVPSTVAPVQPLDLSTLGGNSVSG